MVNRGCIKFTHVQCEYNRCRGREISAGHVPDCPFQDSNSEEDTTRVYHSDDDSDEDDDGPWTRRAPAKPAAIKSAKTTAPVTVPRAAPAKPAAQSKPKAPVPATPAATTAPSAPEAEWSWSKPQAKPKANSGWNSKANFSATTADSAWNRPLQTGGSKATAKMTTTAVAIPVPAPATTAAANTAQADWEWNKVPPTKTGQGNKYSSKRGNAWR